MGTYGSFPMQIHDFGCYIDTPELNDANMYRNNLEKLGQAPDFHQIHRLLAWRDLLLIVGGLKTYNWCIGKKNDCFLITHRSYQHELQFFGIMIWQFDTQAMNQFF